MGSNLNSSVGGSSQTVLISIGHQTSLNLRKKRTTLYFFGSTPIHDINCPTCTPPFHNYHTHKTAQNRTSSTKTPIRQAQFFQNKTVPEPFLVHRSMCAGSHPNAPSHFYTAQSLPTPAQGSRCMGVFGRDSQTYTLTHTQPGRVWT